MYEHGAKRGVHKSICSTVETGDDWSFFSDRGIMRLDKGAEWRALYCRQLYNDYTHYAHVHQSNPIRLTRNREAVNEQKARTITWRTYAGGTISPVRALLGLLRIVSHLNRDGTLVFKYFTIKITSATVQIQQSRDLKDRERERNAKRRPLRATLNHVWVKIRPCVHTAADLTPNTGLGEDV
ncbi:hypothetical protein EVAR_58935_1 [Eumeta japonica]|uniref:Uncharacterized protein n=1 Tax=Eumeta variegata TaxID=151549 RepID=A0A4C1Y7J5_EUMVA|nr:hypothetical protein EVAR_58935_1 [Eumeta japonica]